MDKLLDRHLEYYSDAPAMKDFISNHFANMKAKLDASGATGTAEVATEKVITSIEKETNQLLSNERQFKAFMVMAVKMGNVQQIKDGLEIAKRAGINLLDIRDKDENTLPAIAALSKNKDAIFLVAKAMTEAGLGLGKETSFIRERHGLIPRLLFGKTKEIKANDIFKIVNK